MRLPAFLMSLPRLDLPVPETVVEGRAIRSDHALLAFFIAHQDFDLPMHSHGAQRGCVLEGELTLTMNGETRTHGPGGSYDIPAGVEHSGRLKAGTIVMDAFEDNDRYALLPPGAGGGAY